MNEPSFSVVGQTVALVGTAFAFTLGLAMNNALQLSFAQIPLPDTNPVVHAWVYFAVIFPVVILTLYLLFRFSRFWNSRSLLKKNSN